jgi:hypothetical protein
VGGARGGGAGGVTWQPAAMSTATTQATLRNGRTMGWIYLEAAVALAIAIGIVAWTMGARRKPDANTPPRDDDAK